MQRDLEAYRVANSAPAPAARPVPLDPPRVNFLSPQQDSMLGLRVIGSLSVCAAVLGLAAFLLI